MLLNARGILEPSMEQKVRLKREYGMYTLGFSEPFGDEHLEGSEVETCAIRMISSDHSRSPASTGMFTNPHVKSLLAKIPKPKFSGHEVDWKEFAREWQDWCGLLGDGGHDVSDRVMLELLKDSLDPVSRKLLSARKEDDPGLTYRSFWKQLEQDFGKNLPGHYRRQWEQISLRGSALTTSSWRGFISEVKLARVRV